MRRLSKILIASGLSAALCAGSLVSAFAEDASGDSYTSASDAVGYVTFGELTETLYVNWDVACEFIGMYYSDLGYDGYYVSVNTCAGWSDAYKSSLCLSDGTYIGDKYPEAANDYVEVTEEMAADLNSIADAWGWGSTFATDKPADTGYIAFAFAMDSDASSDFADNAEASEEDSSSDESESSDVYVNDDGYADAYSVLGSVAFEDLETPVYVNWDVACYLFEHYYGSGYRYSVSGMASYGDAYKKVLCDADGTYIVDKYPEASGNYVQVTAEMAEDLNEIAWQWYWDDHETGYLALAFVLSDSEEESSTEESGIEESGADADTSTNETTGTGVSSSNDTGDFTTMLGLVSFAACALAVITVSSGKKKEA